MIQKTQLQKFYEVAILHPSEVCVKKYRFEDITTTIVNNKEDIKTIVREIAIRFSGMENNLWRYQIVVLQHNIILQNDKSTAILDKKASIFNEIVVYVNQNGNIVSLLNLKQVQDNWQVAKEELLEKHKGEVLMDFLEDTDDLVANKENILKFITSKEMYGLYFNSLWGYHDVRKPRFEELKITIAKRVQEDMHSQHLQKIFSHDATLTLQKETENKKQTSEFRYKNQQLHEAFLEIEAPNINHKYSIICLTP